MVVESHKYLVLLRFPGLQMAYLSMIEKQHEPKLTLWSQPWSVAVFLRPKLWNPIQPEKWRLMCARLHHKCEKVWDVCVCAGRTNTCVGGLKAHSRFFGFRLGERSDDPLPWGWERASRWCPSCPALKVTSRQGNWFHIKVGMVSMVQPTLRDRWAMNKWATVKTRQY